MNFIKIVSCSLVLFCCAAFASEGPSYNGVNRSIIDDLQRTMDKGDNITSPIAITMTRNLEALQRSEGRSSERIADAVVNFGSVCLDLGSSSDSPVDRNNGLFSAFKSPDKKRKRAAGLVGSAALKASDEVRRQYSVVDADHVISGFEERRSPIAKIRKLHGKHSIEEYEPGSLKPHCVIGQCGAVLGVIAHNKIKKTVVFGMTPEKVVENRQKSSDFAIKKALESTQDDLKISMTLSGDFIGSYQDKESPLIHSTQFPLLVARRDRQSLSKQITLVKLAILNSDYQSIKTSKKSLTVTQSTFDDMMKKGKPLETFDKSHSMVDITSQVEDHFTESIMEHGFISGKLPSSVYGIHDKNK